METDSSLEGEAPPPSRKMPPGAFKMPGMFGGFDPKAVKLKKVAFGAKGKQESPGPKKSLASPKQASSKKGDIHKKPPVQALPTSHNNAEKEFDEGTPKSEPLRSKDKIEEPASEESGVDQILNFLKKALSGLSQEARENFAQALPKLTQEFDIVGFSEKPAEIDIHEKEDAQEIKWKLDLLQEEKQKLQQLNKKLEIEKQHLLEEKEKVELEREEKKTQKVSPELVHEEVEKLKKRIRTLYS